MIAAIKHCLANLANFSGRDAQSTYWWYLLFLFIVQFIIGIVISIPTLGGMVGGAMEAAQSGADPDAINAAMAAEIGGSLRGMITWSTVLSVVMVGLFVAACVRRLNDAAKPGILVLIAILPVLYAAITSFFNIDAVIDATVQAMQQASGANDSAGSVSTGVESWIGYVGYLAALVFGFLPTADASKS